MAGWLDGIKRQDWGTNGGSWTRQPAIIVLHSTETGNGGWPGYDSGQSAPHFTIDPRTGEIRQHISMGHAARALRNPSGGVETNRGGAIQIEIIGSCDPNRDGDSGWTFLPDWTDWAQLTHLLERISDECGIPLTESVTWKAYPGSYGTGASQRMSGGTWNSYRGVCGHQHVPENDHGDPGNLNIQAILEGDDMPSPQEIALAVWQYKGSGSRDAFSYQLATAAKDDVALAVWGYDQQGKKETDAWGYQAYHSEDVYADTQELVTALREVQADLQRSRDGFDPVWRVLLVLALLIGTVAIVLSVT